MEGNTPLHVASARGNLGAAKALIAAGANPFCLNSKHKTPINYAGTPYLRNFLASSFF